MATKTKSIKGSPSKYFSLPVATYSVLTPRPIFDAWDNWRKNRTRSTMFASALLALMDTGWGIRNPEYIDMWDDASELYRNICDSNGCDMFEPDESCIKTSFRIPVKLIELRSERMTEFQDPRSCEFYWVGIALIQQMAFTPRPTTERLRAFEMQETFEQTMRQIWEQAGEPAPEVASWLDVPRERATLV